MGCGLRSGDAPRPGLALDAQDTHVIVEIHLNGVPLAGDVSLGDRLPVAVDFRVHLRLFRQGVAALEVVGGELGLPLGDRHDRAERLDQSDEVQPGHRRVEHPFVEPDLVVSAGVKKVTAEEGERDLVSGAVDHQVGRDAAAVGEDHGVAVEPLDGGLRDNGAVGQPVEHPAGHGRVCLGELVVGLLEAVARHRSRGRAHEQPGDGPADPGRDLLVPGDLVVGLAEDVLGNDVHPAPVGEVGLGRMIAGVHADVHGRVAHAEHHHPLADELLLVLVVVGVYLFAGEGLRSGEGGLRHSGVPVLAVGDHDRAVEPGLLAVQPHLEAAAGERVHLLHAGVEGDLVPESEVVPLGVEVRGDLVVAGEVGQGLGHREVAELHPAAGGLDVQGLVRRRYTVAVVMLEWLEAHVAEQRRFAANASHELRTPLAISQTLLEVARNDPNLDVNHLIDRLHAVNIRAIDLTQALLMLSRADQRFFTSEPVDLSLLLDEAIETLLPLAEKRRVRLLYDGGEAPPSAPVLCCCS